jgi:maltose O-acetyltransferase
MITVCEKVSTMDKLMFSKISIRQWIKSLVFGDPLQKHIKRGLKVGKNFSMLEEVILDFSHTFHIEIGDDVTMAPRVHVLAHDASTKQSLGYTRIGQVTIGNRVFIGASAIVLPGVVIGDDVIIGAGSVVSSNIPSGHLVAGNPAKVICKTADYLSRKKNEMKEVPCFGEEYTYDAGVTDKLIDEMNTTMTKRIGYIV